MSGINDTISNLRKRVDAFHKLARPWSIAELRVTEEEFADLQDWYKCLEDLYHKHYWLVLVLMVEINRRSESSCDDDKLLWPPIFEELYEINRSITSKLFIVNTKNPNKELYTYIESTAYSKRLNADVGLAYLRDLFQYQSGKNYYNFMNLQCGLTFRTISKLQDWVSIYYDSPDDYYDEHRIRIAVRCLLSGHIDRITRDTSIRSVSFVELWKTIHKYTSGEINHLDLRRFLVESPWIMPNWVVPIIESTPKPKKPYQGKSSTSSINKTSTEQPEWIGNPRICHHNTLIMFKIPVYVDYLAALSSVEKLSKFESFSVRCGDDEITYSWDNDVLEPDLNHTSNVLRGTLGNRYDVMCTIHDENGEELESALVHLLEFDGEPCLYSIDGNRVSNNTKLYPNRQYLTIWPTSWNLECRGNTSYTQHCFTFCSFTASETETLVLANDHGDEVWSVQYRDDRRISANELRSNIMFTPTSDGFTILTKEPSVRLHSIYIAGYTEGYEKVLDESRYEWHEAGSITRSSISVRIKLQGHGNPFTPYDDEHKFMNPCEFISYSEMQSDKDSWTKLSETDYVEIDAISDHSAIRYWPGAADASQLEAACLLEESLTGSAVQIGYVTNIGDVVVSGKPKGLGGRLFIKLAGKSCKALPFVSVSRGCVEVNAPSLQHRDGKLFVRLRSGISAERKITIRVWNRNGIGVYDAYIVDNADNSAIRIDGCHDEPYLMTVLSDGREVGWVASIQWYKCYESDMNPSLLVDNLKSMRAPILDSSSFSYLQRYFLKNSAEYVRTLAEYESHDIYYECLFRESINGFGSIAKIIDNYKFSLGSDNDRIATIITICHKQGPVTAFRVALIFDVSISELKKTLHKNLFRNVYRDIQNGFENTGKRRRGNLEVEEAIRKCDEDLSYEDVIGMSKLPISSGITQEKLNDITNRLISSGTDNNSMQEQEVDVIGELTSLISTPKTTASEYVLVKICEGWLVENA